MTHKWSSWDHFWPFFGQLHENISEKKGSTIILRCLVFLNLNWIKGYDIILVIRFFFMPENALFQGYFAKVRFGTSKETSSHIFKTPILPKFFGAFMKYIIR